MGHADVATGRGELSLRSYGWARRLRFSYALSLRQNFHKVNITSQRVKKRYSEIIEIGKIMGTVEQTWRTLTVWFQNR